MSALLDKAIAIGLLVAVVFTTLAHGAVESWSLALFELMVIGLVLLWALKAVADKHFKLILPRATIPVAALFALGVIESFALPGVLSLSMDVEATRQATATMFFLLASFIIAANFFTTRERLKTLSRFIVIYG